MWSGLSIVVSVLLVNPARLRRAVLTGGSSLACYWRSRRCSATRQAAEQYLRGCPGLRSAMWTGRGHHSRWQPMMTQSGCSGQAPGIWAGL
jgi:hypothetical protein